MDNQILENLKNKGYRITKTRQAMVEIFESTKHPVEAKTVHSMLKKLGYHVNITTVYREIDFLLAENIIEKVPLKDTELHYELKGRNHHHHLMCVSCGDIEDIELKNEYLILEEAHKSSGFKINRHSLAFFGKCPKCQ